MKKRVLFFLFAVTLIPAWVRADVGEVSGITFSGTITAIETDRDSITVESSAHQVKMFAVSPESKGNLKVGEKVTVQYIDGSTWPLKSLSVSGVLEK
ncbi:MAG: hypothetical protein PHD76_10025 [Methylacidiphilales bacterium]|nr:hypothetical protein [Candidatus Methylacidiphilales bacterium]